MQLQKFLLLSFLTLFAYAPSVKAQMMKVDTSSSMWKERHSYIIKTAPMAMIFSQIPLTAELRLGAELIHSASYTTYAAVSFNYISPLVADSVSSWITQQGYDITAYGFRLQGGIRYYLFTPAPHGIWIGPHASLNKVYINFPQYPEFTGQVTFMNVNLLAGLQIIYNTKFSVEAFGGLGYRYNTFQFKEPGKISTRKIHMEDLFPGFPPDLKITLGVQVGMAF